jgi:multiple sugar transport system substrate-binding protein
MRALMISLAAAAAITGMACQSANAETSIDVLYAVPANYKILMQQMVSEFQKLHPDIVVRLRNPADTYESATAEALRSAIIGDVPDVLYQGLNQVRVLVDQGHAVALDGFVARPKEWTELGYIPSMASLGEVRGKRYGLPFAISTPVTYINEELFEKAGAPVNSLPDNWPDIIALGKKLDDPANKVVGFLYAYTTTGNWFYQALITSTGGAVGSPDGCKVAFDDARGKAALDVLETFAKAGMPEMSWSQGRQAFAAGTLAIFVESSSGVAGMERAVAGRFKWRTLPFPVIQQGGRLPAGGTVAMILAKSPEKQKAAWEYLKFATGPVGQTMMAKLTGYAPGNQKPLSDPALLGGYYEARPLYAAGVQQLPIMTGWYNWAGPNSVKIVDVIQNHINDVVGGRKTAAQTMPAMAADVQKLLPRTCPAGASQ